MDPTTVLMAFSQFMLSRFGIALWTVILLIAIVKSASDKHAHAAMVAGFFCILFFAVAWGIPKFIPAV